MKDLVHHMKHLQRKVIASSKKAENNHQENKSTPLMNSKKKVYDSQ